MSGSPRPIRRPRDVRHGVVVPTQVDRTFTTVDESWRSARGRTASINPLSVSLRFAATAPRRFRSAVKSRKALGGTLPRKQRLPSCGAGVGVARTRPRAAARAGKTCCSYSCPLDAVAPRAAMLLDVTLPGGVPLLGQLPPTSRVPRICAAQCLEGRLGQAAVSGAGRPVHGGPARPGHTERDQLQGRVRLYRYFDTLESTRGDCVIPSSRRPRTYTETVSYTGGRAERGRAGDLLRAGGLAWTAECRALGTRLQQDQPLQLCKAKVHDCLCRVKFYGIFSKNPHISGIEECYRSYRGKTTGAACGICRQHNGTKNGRVNAETPAKKKPRLA